MTSAQMRDLSVFPEPAITSEVAAEEVDVLPTAPMTPFARVAGSNADRGYEIAKRMFDVAVGVLLLLSLLPLLLVTALLVKATSPGPAFFRQRRCGREGRTFTCYKFRTMVDGADALKGSLLARNEVTGPIFKIRNDPRVTPLGRLLRKTSIDELPQLLNVIRGEMSLVGPRPPLPEEVATYSSCERLRLSVPAGLTCLWQVSGRSNLSFEQWMELDLEYVDEARFLVSTSGCC